MRTDTAPPEAQRRPTEPADTGPPAARPGDWRERALARRQTLVEFDDLFHAATFLAAEVVARLVPEHNWRTSSRAFAHASLAVRRRRVRRHADRIATFLAGHVADDLDPEALVASIVAASFEERVFFRRAAHDPAWRPEVRLDGREQLEAALSAGRGAVLWVAPMTFSTLLVKIALHDAGYRVGHLSVPWHGLGHSRFGRWLVNARSVAVEARFVERVVMPGEGRADSALAELGRRLRRNEVVTFTAVGYTNQPLEVPFLAGRLRLGPGAPRLALARRAPLIAAITARDDAGAFHVRLEPLAAAGEDAGRPDENAVERLACAFAAAYTRAVVESPALWNVHLSGSIAPPDPPPAAGAAS